MILNALIVQKRPTTSMLNNVDSKNATQYKKPKWLITLRSAITWDLWMIKQGAMRKQMQFYNNWRTKIAMPSLLAKNKLMPLSLKDLTSARTTLIPKVAKERQEKNMLLRLRSAILLTVMKVSMRNLDLSTRRVTQSRIQKSNALALLRPIDSWN